MRDFKGTSLNDRLQNANKAKQALLEKMRAAPKFDDPDVVARREAKAAQKAANQAERERRRGEKEAAARAEAEAKAAAEAAAKAEAERSAVFLVRGDGLRAWSHAGFEAAPHTGAFELPLAAHYCAASGRYAGVACLGAVIRGETDHYDFVCSEAARGIQNVQLDTGIPCGFGVLTVENMDQALARTGGGKRDSGANAAAAVLHMNQLRETLSS